MTPFRGLWYNVKQGFCLDYKLLRETSRNENNLTQAVPGLGEAGAVKGVADGYARNYLLPRKLAMTATKGSMKQALAQADVYTRRAQKVTSAAQQAAAALEGKVVKIAPAWGLRIDFMVRSQLPTSQRLCMCSTASS